MKMDDLDHSMCIADHDWKNFFEETEECWLLQPLLACPDNWSLSDSEDSGNLSVSLGTDRLELCQNEGGESNTVGCCAEDWEISQSRSGGEQDNLTAKAKAEGGRRAKPATCCDTTAPCAEAGDTEAAAHVLQVTSVPGTLRTEPQNAPSLDEGASELKKGDGDTQKEGNALSVEEPDPLSFEQRELSAGKDVSAVASRTEKERWFITVCDGPPRQQARTKAAKTKMRQKKTSRKENKRQRLPKTKACKSGREVQSDEISAAHPSYGGGAVETTFDNMLTDVDCQNPSGPVSSTGHSGLDSETGNSLEFVLAHSWDSDSYLSAEEEYQEARHLPSSATLRKNPTCDSMVYPAGDTVPHNCESTDTALALPSAAQSANKSPNDSSECDAGEGRMPAEIPGRQAHGSIHPSASVSKPGDECGLHNVPDVTLTPCTVADSPETYAAAAGHRRPVYAISAFWDEMEKLTINDILQLRMGRGSPTAGADKTAAPHDDLAESHGSAVDPAELSLPDAGLTDGSDNADSDYFTQPDDSKPDRSSCEFSASDFEEEYWQFLGTSRNPSPDPQAGNIRNHPCVGREEEEESTGSEGRDTPVPPDSSDNWTFEHQEAFTSDNPTDQRPILKSKSMRNIQALSALDLCLDSKDESSSFLCSCLSPEGENTVEADDELQTQISSVFAPDPVAGNDWTQTSVLEVPECYYTKDVGTNSGSVIVYNPGDISPVSALDHSFLYTLCCSHISKEKPVPIFSYNHSTIRELTFPNYIFLSAEPLGDTLSVFTDTGGTRDIDSGLSAEAPDWFYNWTGLLPRRKTHFHGKGSIWWKGSGAKLFPVEDPELFTDKADLQIPGTDSKSISTTGPQTCRDIAVQQRISDPLRMRQDYFFSKVRQSDMCLVCIAFASWVLRSSDPDAADTWKAALLANVSALSAIQYLRQYMRRKPSKDKP